MPFLRLTHGGPEFPPDVLQMLAQNLTRLMAEVLDKDPELTVLAVQKAQAGNWFVHGKAVESGAQLDVQVTFGTNTPGQIARFLEQAYELIGSALPLPASPIYIQVQSNPATDWGYDGRSQAARHARLESPQAARK